MPDSPFEERKSGWSEFYANHAERGPRDQLAPALERLREQGGDLQDKQALDIAAGTMRETKAMLEAGIGHVIATDQSELAENAAAHLQMDYNDFGTDEERLDFWRITNEELAERLQPGSFDLITAYYALPFTLPDDFPRLWSALTAALKPGGVLSVTLFGDHDAWATARRADGQPRYQKMTFHTRDDVNKLLDQWDDAEIVEREYDSKTTDGIPKHWHTYDILATKPDEDRTTPENQV